MFYARCIFLKKFIWKRYWRIMICENTNLLIHSWILFIWKSLRLIISFSRLIVININSRLIFSYTSCSTFVLISFISCWWLVIMTQISSIFIEKRLNESFATSKTHSIFDSFISTISFYYLNILTRIETRIMIHVEASSITCLTLIAIKKQRKTYIFISY